MDKLQQFNIMAFEYDRLKNSDFNISISARCAFKNGELIALADNECLRAIRKITNHKYDKNELELLLKAKKALQKESNTEDNRKKAAFYNQKIEEQLFIPEFVILHSPKKSDYKKICEKGFIVNGEKFVWLMCGAGHQRTDRSIYCNEKIYEQLNIFLSCGAKEKEIILSKYNAYYALSSSATRRVTTPRVCVVPDKNVEMIKTVDWITSENVIERQNRKVTCNLWDGMGIISPEMAKKWAEDVGLDYLPSAFGIRNAFIKGLVCVFDFHEFATDISKTETITDIYGEKHLASQLDMILTESQFKLWRNYDNWENYCKINKELGWSWGISKISPKTDTDYILSTYQFLQVLDLSEKEIVDICQPTVDWLNGVSCGEIEPTLIYLLGKIANKDNANIAWNSIQDNFIKSLIVENRLIEDTYIRNRIMKSLNKRIKESYIGKLIFKGNYQLMLADPYALCEHIFGMEIKGLLSEHQHFSCYWNRKNVANVVAMRSPLTWRSEVNKLNLQNSEKMNYWYKYMTSGIVYNIWGSDCMIHADSDFDGDLICTINNETLLKAYERI